MPVNKVWLYQPHKASWDKDEHRSVCTYYFYIGDVSPIKIKKESWVDTYRVMVYSKEAYTLSLNYGLDYSSFKADSLEAAKFKSLIVAKLAGWDITDEDMKSWSKPEMHRYDLRNVDR